MNIKNYFSNMLYKYLEKREVVNEDISRSIRYGGSYATGDNILESSDVFELLQDISNQMTLAEIVIVEADGTEVIDHPMLNVLRYPNEYLTGSEFIKLMTNVYLIHGEVFPFLNGNQIHLLSDVQSELDEKLKVSYKLNGVELPTYSVRHIKNVGTNHLKGVGILELGQRTLDGVMNAEKVLTDKYAKGGLLAYLLRLDAHINPQNSAQSRLIKVILDQLESIDDSRSIKLIPLGKGYNIEALESAIDDGKILNYLNVYKKDLSKFLNINVDTYTALIKSDLEKAMMYLHNKAVRPIMRNFEDHLTILFFGQNSSKRIKFKINILDFVTYSTKTNIGYNIVRTGITSPDNVAEMLGFPKQNTPETQAVYISNDLSRIGEKQATDNSLKGGENDESGNSEQQRDA